LYPSLETLSSKRYKCFGKGYKKRATKLISGLAEMALGYEERLKILGKYYA